MNHALSVLLVSSTLAWPLEALAKDPIEAPVQDGQALYNQGRTAFDAGSYDEACALFEQSYAASGSNGALLSWAECEEKRGRLGVAYELWLQGEALLVREPERAEFARTRAAALEARLVAVRVTVPPDGSVARVDVDGMKIDPGRGAHVEGGRHTLRVTRKSGATEDQTFEAALGKPVELKIEPSSDTTAPPLPPKVTEPASPALAIAGWTLVGVGAASLVGFAITGGMFLSECGDVSRCAQPEDEVLGLGIANAVLLGAGALFGISGGALLVVDAVGAVSEDRAFLGVRARF